MKITDVTDNQPAMKIFVDLDGVLADFAKGVVKIFPDFIEGKTENDKSQDREMWKSIANFQKRGGEFWYSLDLMPDAMQLWTYVKPHGPEILTAAGQPQYNAAEQKHRWVAEKLGPSVKVNVTQRAREKAQFAQPGFVLIDDKMKAIQPWIDAGGIGVLHTSAANTIRQLKELGL